jgi:hypothetical protein
MTTMEQGEGARPEEIAGEPASGPAAAAILAAGIGALVLGILTTWAEASEGFKEDLQWNDKVGPLSGKTITGAIRLLRIVARPAPRLATVEPTAADGRSRLGDLDRARADRDVPDLLRAVRRRVALAVA